MRNIAVVSPDALDFGSFVELQRCAFAEIIEKNGIDYLFSEALYKWKYSPPSGSAKVALVRDEQGFVAAVSTCPVGICANGAYLRGWQFCDIATHPRMQNRGLFSQCLHTLTNECLTKDLFFVFPNKNSEPRFKTFGFSHVSDLRTWISVISIKSVDRFQNVESVRVFDADFDIFFRELSREPIVILQKNSAYMNWRYNQHPLHQYERFFWRESGRVLGAIVLRRIDILGRALAIAMEVLALNRSVERGLLSFAAAWGQEMRTNHTLAINNSTEILNGIFSAYLPVPIWALPKRQQLMILQSFAPNGSKALLNTAWNIQIGDWDGF